MTSAFVRPEATATVGATALPISQGKITLAEDWSPYCQASFTVPIADDSVIEQINPRENQRVVVTATEGVSGTTRTFDLGVRSRSVDQADGTITIEAESDEALLFDYAPLAVDNTPRTYESDFRALVNYVLNKAIPGAALEAGTTNADLTAYWSEENLMKNARAAVNTATWSTGSGTGNLTRVTGLTGLPVTTGFRFTLTANAGTYWDFRSEYLPVRVGQQVNARASVRASTSRQIRLLVSFFEDTTFIKETWADVTTGTTFAVLAASGVAPPRATHARIIVRAVASASSGSWIEGTAFKVYEGTVLDNSYYDGNTPNTANYTYQWAGDPNESAAQRVAVVERSPELFVWKPGVSAHDFLEPLLVHAGLRLFCDETRTWRLVDPKTYEVPGYMVVQSGHNATRGEDTITRNDDTWADAVVYRYTWVDVNGVSREEYDTAGLTGKVLTVEVDREYPGAGAAAYHLYRLQGRGRTQVVEALLPYTATPGQGVTINLPGTLTQTGKVRETILDLATGLTELGTRDLTDTLDGAWLTWDPTETWSEVDPELTWNEA